MNTSNSLLDKNGLYCAYLRKSRDDLELEKHGEYDVLKRHRETLSDLAGKLGIRVETFYEEVISGDSIDSRPQMCALLGDVDSGMWDGVLVMEVERLARGDTIDQGRVARSFQYSDTLIITPLKIYNPNDEYDEEYFEFGLFMSRREYKTIKRRMQRGRLRSVQDGKYVGSIPPYGYERIRIPDDSGFTLTPAEQEAAVVRMIFQLYVHGLPGSPDRLGMQKIADYLNACGYKPMRAKSWSCAGVKTILANPVYCGYVRWNSRSSVKHIQDGEITRSRPVNHNCDVYKGLHEPLISEELFRQAADIRANSHCVPVGSQHTQKNPFAGLIFCSVCGAPMQRKQCNSSGHRDSLVCPTRGCPTIGSCLDQVEAQFIDFLRELSLSYTYEISPDASTQAARKEKRLQIRQKESELQDITAQSDKLFDFLERGIYPEDIFQIRRQKIQTSIQETEHCLNILRREYDMLSCRIQDEKGLLPKCERLTAVYPTLSPGEKNLIWKELIEKAVYTKKKKNTSVCPEQILFTLDFFPKMRHPLSNPTMVN